jgi:hypothetical protein
MSIFLIFLTKNDKKITFLSKISQKNFPKPPHSKNIFPFPIQIPSLFF